MDELDLLHDVLSNPEPSADMVDNRRYELHRLINQRTRPRTRTPGWRISALGLTAATAAVAATVVLTQHPAPVTPRRTHPQAAAAQPTGSAQSAQQILLVAATSAPNGHRRHRAATGTYAPARSGTTTR